MGELYLTTQGMFRLAEWRRAFTLEPSGIAEIAITSQGLTTYSAGRGLIREVRIDFRFDESQIYFAKK